MDMSVCPLGPLGTFDCLRTPSMTTLVCMMFVQRMHSRIRYKFSPFFSNVIGCECSAIMIFCIDELHNFNL
jgi:hypothetical protein